MPEIEFINVIDLDFEMANLKEMFYEKHLILTHE